LLFPELFFPQNEFGLIFSKITGNKSFFFPINCSNSSLNSFAMKRNPHQLAERHFLTGKGWSLQTVNRENPVDNDPPTGGGSNPPPPPPDDDK
jgi:hypothetical protein